jgi:uncharacterized protein YndB with AHSA1/START domain
MTETETATGELAYSLDLPQPPEKVWRALTVKAFCERWLLKPDGKAGGRLAGKARGLDRHVEITVVDAEPLRRLIWLWQEEGEAPGCVTVTLTPRLDGGTRLDLVHEPRWAGATANTNTGPVALAA